MKTKAESDSLTLLFDQHKLALENMDRLEEAANAIRSGGFSGQAFERIAAVMRYIDTDFRMHDDAEERFLFPLIERHAPGATADYSHEHLELRSALSELRGFVSDIEEGRMRGSTIFDVLHAAETVVRILRTHINREETYLLPLAKNVLTMEDLRVLRQQLDSHR